MKVTIKKSIFFLSTVMYLFIFNSTIIVAQSSNTSKIFESSDIPKQSSSYALAADQDDRPNIVLIVTDNHGAWTLGAYGNPDIQTPNIDRLANEGITFTRALANNPVCTPTRATLLTGLIPSQHGVHSFLDQKYQMGSEAYNSISEFGTLYEVLYDAGYTNGLSGKWHLGDNIKPAKGFSYWVTKPEGGTSGFYDKEIIENGKADTVSEYTTDVWTKKGIEFIQQNKDKENPFFLLLTYNGPYGLSNLMTRPPKNRWAKYYKNMDFRSFPIDTMHPWQHANKQFHNKQVAMERYAAELSGVDDGVGEIMSALKRNNLDSNTLVIFIADQGWMGGQNGLWGMGDHTRPMGAHELMMKIPLIFRHPENIAAGQESDIIVSNYDIMPTLLSYLDINAEKSQEHPKSPGRDFSPVLIGEKNFDWENEMFYEMETTRAIRTDQWKFISRYPNGPFELYNMKVDPQERVNMYGQPGSDKKTTELSERLNDFFEKYADPKYNLWKGGKSKARRHAAESVRYLEEYFNHD